MKRAALIGLGMVAGTHLAALRESKDITLAGVLGRDPDKAREFAARAEKQFGHSIANYAALSDLLADERLDFVILTTPPDARKPYVDALADARKPILMEKPIERTLGAAKQLVETCEAADVPLAVVFQHRARASSLALKARIDDGALGRIVSAEIRVPWWRDQSYYDEPGRGTYARDGGGVLMTQAIHTLDLALWLLGPIARVCASLRTTEMHRMEAEDWAGALFETCDGVNGTIFASTAAYPGASETLTFHGTKASAHLDAGKLVLRYRDGREETLGEATATGGGADPMAFTHSWHQGVMENFTEALDGRASLLASGRDSLMVHAAIDAMTRSSAERTWTELG